MDSKEHPATTTNTHPKIFKPKSPEYASEKGTEFFAIKKCFINGQSNQ